MSDLSLLVLRLYAGGAMLLGHGWGKLVAFERLSSTFPDPLGVGHPVSLSLAIFAEVLCALFVTVGAFTRFAVVPLIVTMAVAGFVIHGADPWAKKELAFAYLAMYLSILGAGGGRWSVDVMVRGKR